MNLLSLYFIFIGVFILGIAVVFGVLVVVLMKVSSKVYLDSEELNMKGEDFL